MNVAVATIGHNRSPFELSKEEIEDLYGEAKNWMDGEPIASQERADMVQKLLRDIQKAKKEADERRKEEVKPYDEAKAEIQERYNTLIGKTKSVTGIAILAEEACKEALAPWLAKIEEENRRKAEEARKEALAKQQAAMEAMQNRKSLEDREAAERAVQEAKAAEAEARKLDKAKASAKGAGRAVTLRDYYEAHVTNEVEFARWLWTAHRVEMTNFLQVMAAKLCSAGIHKMPGVDVKHERRPV
ncbi:hypothetical protein [Nitratireductor sp. CH_MIT9313-5]|uniref:hypothetical protein n=1 Tax=Nitratireductor sp. CH_MIT9313-5 TaxID=3107764 RepID=UPI00300890F9